MSLPLNLNPLLVALNQCPVIDGRVHATEVRLNYLWCFVCATGWKVQGGTLQVWLNDIDIIHTNNLKLQIRKIP